MLLINNAKNQPMAAFFIQNFMSNCHKIGANSWTFKHTKNSVSWIDIMFTTEMVTKSQIGPPNCNHRNLSISFQHSNRETKKVNELIIKISKRYKKRYGILDSIPSSQQIYTGWPRIMYRKVIVHSF